MQNLENIRTDYTKASLEIKSIEKNPLLQFEKWFNEAQLAKVLEPNAMSLATSSTDGRPSVRVVLLKGLEDGKFIFYTNYQSRKGHQLAANPACALSFFWPELERQVRIEGLAERVSDEKSLAYFQSRPRGSQVGAWASPQSAIIEKRILLEQRLDAIEKKFEGLEKLPKPQQWGGYSVDPLLFEFWQGRPNRLHDRLEYTKVEQEWKINILAP
jgi:pyridoxamine 5'-phosphate oxidase